MNAVGTKTAHNTSAVATIGLAQVLNGIAILIGIEWSGMSSGGFNTPFGWHFKLGAKVFYGDHILVLIVVRLLGLG